MTASPYDLTTLAILKTYINNGSSNDTLLQQLLTSASVAIESYCNRDFVSKAYTKTFDGSGGNALVLPDYPITAVASVTVNGQTIPAAASVTGTGYSFSENTIVLNGYIFTRGWANITVTYTAGYTTIPDDLVQACCGTVQYWLNDRQRGGETSRSMGGQTITYSTEDMPKWVKTILNQRKRTYTA
jgi:phage gp36-like protein